MKKIIFCLICFVSPELFSQQVEWVKVIYGGVSTLDFYSDNNKLYVAGAEGGMIAIDTQVYSWTGDDKGYIAEFETDGTIGDVFSLKGDFIPSGSVKGIDGHYFAGTATGGNHMCINKNELDGTHGWKHCYISIPPSGQQSTYHPNNRARSITQYQQSLFITGTYQDSIFINNQLLYGGRSFLGKFSSQTGNPIWLKDVPGNNDYGKMKIISLKNGTFLLNTDIYYGGTYYFDSIPVQINNGATVIAKTDTSGAFIWVKAVSERTKVTDMAVDSEKNIFITGNFTDSCRIGLEPFTGIYGGIFIVKLDSLGNILWSKVIESDITWSEVSSSALGIDGNNSIFITGGFSSDTLNLQDTILVRAGLTGNAFLAKYSSTGQFIYALRLNTPNFSFGNDLAVDNDGSVYWTGRFYEQLVINNDTLQGNSFNQTLSNFFIKIANPEYITSSSAITKKANVFRIFPNPGTGRITIDFERSYYKGLSICSIYNTLNEKVYTNKMQGSTQVIDLSAIPKGLYFVEVVADGEKQVKKIVLN